MFALSMNIERADAFLQKYLAEKEVGLIVAEDLPEMKKLFSNATMYLRSNPITMVPECFRENEVERILKILPNQQVFELKCVIDVIHFAKKAEAPLLQLADACAFTFRRCLSRQTGGNELLLAMLGPDQGRTFLNDDVWFSGASSGLFNTIKYRNAEQHAEAKSKVCALNAASAL